jgi:hypothetical protein
MGGGGEARGAKAEIMKKNEFPANRREAVRILGICAENANLEEVSRAATEYLLYHRKGGSGKSRNSINAYG